MNVTIQRAAFTAAIHSPRPLSQPEFSLQKALAKSLSTQPQSTLCLSLGECITASFLHTEPSLEISTMTQGSWAKSVFSSVLFLISSLINLSHPLLSTHSIDPTNHFPLPLWFAERDLKFAGLNCQVHRCHLISLPLGTLHSVCTLKHC